MQDEKEKIEVIEKPQKMKRKVFFVIKHTDYEKDDINIFNQKMIKFLKFVKFDEDEKKYTNVEFLDEIEKNGTQIWKRKGNTKFNFYDTTYRIVDEINVDNFISELKRFKHKKNKETGQFDIEEDEKGQWISWKDMKEFFKFIK